MSAETVPVIQSTSMWLPQTETWLFNQVKYLPPQIASLVVCDQTENLEQFFLPSIHCFSDSDRLGYWVEFWLQKLIQPQRRTYLSAILTKSGAQLVHSHFGDQAWRDLRAVKNAGLKHVVSFYGYDVNLLPALYPKWFHRYQELFVGSDLFLCEGPHMARQVVSLGCPHEKIKVHHLGVEIDAIAYRPRHWQRTEPLKVLIAATFREKKGVPYALEALGRLAGKIPMEITVIGDSTSEQRSIREKQRILEIIQEHGLTSKIRMLGFQPSTVFFAEAYRHHIFLSPSVTATDGDTEGGAPVSIIEMIASGMPVVSTLHCDIPEVLQYGIEDWLVEERNATGLVDRLHWLVEHPDKWEKLTSIGRKHIEAEYDASKQGVKLEKMYRSLVFDGRKD